MELDSLLHNYCVKDRWNTTDGYFYGLFISMGQLLHAAHMPRRALTASHIYILLSMQSYYHKASYDETLN